MKSLYSTFAYPYLTYCIHVWGKTFSTYLDPLIKTHKRIIRVITHSNYKAHTQPLFKHLGLLNLSGIYEYMVAIFMFKFRDNDLPLIFNSMFTVNSSKHDYPTRQADDYQIPNWRLETKRRSISVQGAYIWNRIPTDIKNVSSLNVFKYTFKRHVVATT